MTPSARIADRPPDAAAPDHWDPTTPPDPFHLADHQHITATDAPTPLAGDHGDIAVAHRDHLAHLERTHIDHVLERAHARVTQPTPASFPPFPPATSTNADERARSIGTIVGAYEDDPPSLPPTARARRGRPRGVVMENVTVQLARGDRELIDAICVAQQSSRARYVREAVQGRLEMERALMEENPDIRIRVEHARLKLAELASIRSAGRVDVRMAAKRF